MSKYQPQTDVLCERLSGRMPRRVPAGWIAEVEGTIKKPGDSLPGKGNALL